jgi:hypothetical protein
LVSSARHPSVVRYISFIRASAPPSWALCIRRDASVSMKLFQGCIARGVEDAETARGLGRSRRRNSRQKARNLSPSKQDTSHGASKETNWLSMRATPRLRSSLTTARTSSFAAPAPRHPGATERPVKTPRPPSTMK